MYIFATDSMNLNLRNALIASTISLCAGSLSAQTDIDGIMMAKRNLCSEITYGHSAWNHYWEGTFYRDNANLGTVSTSSVNIMSNYGITDRFNVMFGLPYISTKASAGTLHGLKGIQDLSLMAKYKFFEKEYKQMNFSAIAVAGVSAPMSNYTPDLLPLSIGLHSKNAIGRIILNASRGNLFATLSGSYMALSNIKLDRESYYTTELINSNIVNLPNKSMMQIRLGYRKDQLLLEAFADHFNTIGGFDIRKNDMPFASNNMDMTRVGANVKIPIPKTNGLGIAANTNYTLAGRNVGRSFGYAAGLFYIAEFAAKGDKK